MEEVLGSPQTKVIFFTIIVNLLLGVASALRDGDFTLAELGGIIQKSALILGGYLGISLTGDAVVPAAGNVVNTVAAVLATAPFAASAVKNIRDLGVPVEKVLGAGLTKMVTSKPPDPLAATKSLAVELRDLMAAYASGDVTADDVKKKATALRIAYPGYPGLPAGWPGGNP